jgi:hypothetical protein
MMVPGAVGSLRRTEICEVPLHGSDARTPCMNYSKKTGKETFGATHSPKRQGRSTQPDRHTAIADVPWDAIVLKNTKYVREMTTLLAKVGPQLEALESARKEGDDEKKRLLELLQEEIENAKHLDYGVRANILSSLGDDIESAFREYLAVTRGAIGTQRASAANRVLGSMSPASVGKLPMPTKRRAKKSDPLGAKLLGVRADIAAGEPVTIDAVLTSTSTNTARRLISEIKSSFEIEEREPLPDEDFEAMAQLYHTKTINERMFDSFVIGYQTTNCEGFMKCVKALGIS